ncbi:MAG TPA: PEP-CTERM sorting domain-containing protein [Gemmatimonadales bacterium]|nr:PEP-CTERM sorting domain-containing protein [Gemmatimonadales bacterium]
MSLTTRFTKAAVLALGLGAGIATPSLAAQDNQGSDPGSLTGYSFGAGFTTQLSPRGGWIADYFSDTDGTINLPPQADIIPPLPGPIDTIVNPEPGTMVLLGTGLLVLALVGYRRNKRHRGRSTLVAEGRVN